MDMIQLLEDYFSDDYLKNDIESKPQLKAQLYPDFVKNLLVDETYKTNAVAKMLGKSDANLRYYLRELESYIEPLRTGRSYRLTYKSIFRLHMVILLINEGYLLDDILVKLRMKSETMNNKGRKAGEERYDEDTIEQILFNFKQQLDQSQETNKLMAGYMDKRFYLYEQTSQLQAKEYEIKLIDEQMDLLELKLSHHREEKKRHKQNLLMLQKEKSNGWLSGVVKMLKKEDDEEVQRKYDAIIEQSEDIEEDEMEATLKERLKELENRKKYFEEERTALEAQTKSLKEKLTEDNSLYLLESIQSNK